MKAIEALTVLALVATVVLLVVVPWVTHKVKKRRAIWRPQMRTVSSIYGSQVVFELQKYGEEPILIGDPILIGPDNSNILEREAEAEQRAVEMNSTQKYLKRFH